MQGFIRTVLTYAFPMGVIQRSLVLGVLTVAVTMVLGAAAALGQSPEVSTNSGVSPMRYAEAFFAALGVGVALVLAGQRIFEWYRAYVVCSLAMSNVNGRTVALESTSVYRRPIRWACLVVSRQDAHFLDLISDVYGGVTYTNDIIRLSRESTLNSPDSLEKGLVCLLVAVLLF